MKSLTIAGAAAALLLAGCDGASGKKSGTANLAGDYAKSADALIAKMGPGKPVPAAGDPAVRAYNSEAEQALAAIGTEALPANSFETYDALCGKGTAIIQAYLHSGLAEGGDAMTQAAAMTANAEKYLDQMFTPLLFSARCTAAHLPFIDQTLSEADVKAKPQALAQIRGGAWSQATGLLSAAGDPKLDAPRRKRILDLLAEDAGRFAIVFNPAQRQQFAQIAQGLKPNMPADAQGDADRIASGVQQAPCGKLCRA